MATGEHGTLGLPVQEPVMVELKLAIGTVIIPLRPMEEQLAKERDLKFFPATQHPVDQANIK